MREAFNLHLFGFDVIVPSSSSPSSSSSFPVRRIGGNKEEEEDEGEGEGEGEGELLIVDVNFFPSFKEVQDFPARLRSFLREKTRERRREGGGQGGAK